MGKIVDVELGGVAGLAGHLEAAVAPVDGLADDGAARNREGGVEGHSLLLTP
jgi:hypothetical protein